MSNPQQQLMKSYLDNAQMTLETAHYTKVGASWGYEFENPEVNRLYYIREGEGWIRLRGRLYRPTPGQLLLLPAGMRLGLGLLEGGDPFGKYWCHFTASVGDIHLFQMIELPHCIRVTEEAWLEEQFRRLIALYRTPTLTAPLRIKGLLMEIISYYMEEAAAQQQESAITLTPSFAEGKISTVLNYIDGHLDSQMTVEELARLVHFHPNYFMQYFKTMLGLSPIAYINRKRMDLAKELLRTEELSVTEAAERVGMELYYFSRLFKKQTGFSPTEYRKNAGYQPPDPDLPGS